MGDRRQVIIDAMFSQGLEAIDEAGNSLLQKAISIQDNALCFFLLYNNPNLHHQNSFGYTALHSLVLQDNFLITDALLSSVDSEKQTQLLTIGDYKGDTPVHFAVTSNNYVFVKYFLNCLSVDPDTIKNIKGYSPGDVAVMQGNLDTLQLFPIKQSFVYLAIEHGHETIVKYLVDGKRIKLHQPNEEGLTVVHVAAKYNRKSILQYLYTKKANVYSLTNDGNTALHVAAEAGSLEIVKWLVGIYRLDKKQKFILHKNNYKRSALHYAVRKGQSDIVEILIKYSKKL